MAANIYNILSGLHEADVKLNNKIETEASALNTLISNNYNTITTGYLNGFTAEGSLKAAIDEIKAKIGDTGEGDVTLNEQVILNKQNIEAVSGNLNTVSGNLNTVSGNLNTVSANLNTVSGDLNTVSANLNTVSGDLNTVSGKVDQLVTDSAVTVTSSGATGEYANVYTITQGGETVGTINIPKDQFLANVSYDHTTKDLTFTYELSGSKSDVVVPIDELVDVYTVAADSEGYLTISGNEIKLSGIDAAISAAIAGLNIAQYATITYVDTQDAATLSSAKKYTDDEIDALNIAQYATINYVDGEVDGALLSAKNYADAQITALNIDQYATDADVAFISGVLAGYTTEGSVKADVDAADAAAAAANAAAVAAQGTADQAVADAAAAATAAANAETNAKAYTDGLFSNAELAGLEAAINQFNASL